ncbi:hemagglutinin domain protein [Burkholderia pseudomallei]|nr:hemagglutinin domain protein [Burkholderia pseudomallei]
MTGSRGAPSNAILSNNGGDDANANANGATGNGPYSNLTDSSSVGPGKNFTATQKKNIIEQNMANNGGELRSDLDGTLLVPASKSQKGVTPPPNEVQIDHIVAKNPADSSAPAGTNSYSNAQVLSREQNRDKSNKPPK